MHLAVMLQVEVLEREVARLRGEKAAAREECRRLRQQGAQDSAEIEHLTQRLLQLAGGGGSKQPSRQASPVKQADVSAREQQQGSTGGSPAMLEQQSKQPACGGIGSPIEEPVAAGGQHPAASSLPAGDASGRRRPGSSPRSNQPQPSSPSAAAAAGAAAVSLPGRRAASGPASPGPAAAASPSAADMRHFRREMQHTLHTAERPGVVSRFPHSLGCFLELRPDLEASAAACGFARGGKGSPAMQLPADQLQACQSLPCSCLQPACKAFGEGSMPGIASHGVRQQQCCLRLKPLCPLPCSVCPALPTWPAG